MYKTIKLLIAAVTLSLLLLGLRPISGAEAGGIHGRGIVCNYSWVTIQVTWKNPEWEVGSLGPGQCSDALSQDVDVIWGRDCDGYGQCWYQGWKVSDGFFYVTDSYVSPLPPGRVVELTGWGTNAGWYIDPTWPKPDLDSLQYGLTY